MSKSYAEQVQILRNGGLTEAAEKLSNFQTAYSVFHGQTPSTRLVEFIDFYNFLSVEKERLGVTGNNLRNTVGVLFEDYLTNVMIECCRGYDRLDVFNQVKTQFGRYILWERGQLREVRPSELSDIVVGYCLTNSAITPTVGTWPKPIVRRLEVTQEVMPLLLVSSKVRVSQPEFFDWLGRAQLMAKGHPHCLTIQIALRKEMDLNVIEVAQSTDHWFQIGDGHEGQVRPIQDGMERLLQHILEHFRNRLT